MAADKRSSYPSRQTRQGPAPLASFEDLSDEIESPTEKNSHSLPEIEEELKLFADAATPSTPRLLANTPSTPQADISDASTPRAGVNGSWGTNLDEDGGATSGSAFVSQSASKDSMLDSSHEGIAELHSEKTCVTLPQNNAIKNSKSSSFMDDVRGAEAASVLANSLPERSATPECLPQKAPTKKKDSLTTTKEANGQRSRTPSRTPSPNSPRRFFSFFKHKDESSEPGSPSSPKSPKSPRLTSFTNLFRIGSRSPDDHSPTGRRKGSLSIFFKGGKEGKNKNAADEPASAKGKKEASNRSVFSSLFRKDDKKSPIRLTLQATSVDVPVEIDLGTGTGWTSREISLHSHLCDLEDHDHVEDVEDVESDQNVEEDESVTVDNEANSTSVQVHVESHEVDHDESASPSQSVQVKKEETKAKPPRKPERRDKFASTDNHKSETSEDNNNEKKDSMVGSIEDKISSGSEQESDCDPVSLKKRVTDEDYEAETLIDDEPDYDDFPVNSLISEMKRTPLTPLRRQRAVDITTVPIERPRSSTPLSITSLEAYIQTASPPPSRLSKEAEKLKVCLPGEEFTVKGKSPRKITAVRNWQQFCQEALHSPRVRRRDSEELQLQNRISSSAPESSSTGLPAASWVTFENVVAEVRKPRTIGTGAQTDEPITSQRSFEQQAESASTANLLEKDEERCLFPSDNFSASVEGDSTEADFSRFTEGLNDYSSSNLFYHSEPSASDVTATTYSVASSLPERIAKKVEVQATSEQTSSSKQPSLDTSKMSKVFNGTDKERVLSQESADSARLSSEGSIGSFDVPVRLDTVECKDPLLDPASEGEFSMDDSEKNLYWVQ